MGVGSAGVSALAELGQSMMAIEQELHAFIYRVFAILP